MSKRLNPAIFGSTPDALSRRIENIERFLGQFSTERIVAATDAGDNRMMEVLNIDFGLGEKTDRPPFEVKIGKRNGKEYATVSPGIVCERVTDASPAVLFHVPDGIFDGEKLKEHSIGDGKSIAVQVRVLKSGGIGTEVKEEKIVEIVVVPTGEESSHYIPFPVGDQKEGAEGIMIYELAKFTKIGNKLVKENVHAGSHICHWRDLPLFRKEAGVHDIFFRFDRPSSTYKTKGLTEELCGRSSNVRTVKITDNGGGDLKFKTDGSDFNLKIIRCRVTWNTGIITVAQYPDEDAFTKIYFRGGVAFLSDPDEADVPEIEVNSPELGSFGPA
jgi:hypothetical protein